VNKFSYLVGKIKMSAKIFIFFVSLILVATACGTSSPQSDIKLSQSWTLENCVPQGGQLSGMYYDIVVWENRKSDAVATIQLEERLLGSNDVVLDSQNIEIQIAPGGSAVSMVSLNSGDSRTQDIKRTVNSTYFAETSIEGQDKIEVQTFFRKTESNTIVLGLDINNKSDFGITPAADPIALVINSQNKVIDILAGELEERVVKVDSIANMTFTSITQYYNSSPCFQSDYLQEEVTFWYFVPLQISTGSTVQFSLSGKAVYKP